MGARKKQQQRMKKGQSIIALTRKDGGATYLFGSLAAIYDKFSAEELGVGYPALRNAVSKYIRENNVQEEVDYLQVVYDAKRSWFTLSRAPFLIASKKEQTED